MKLSTMSQDFLKSNKRVTNILWLGFEKFGLVLLSTISFLIFAIYLSPAELGLAAIAIVFCELLTRFLSSIFENPLVRRQASDPTELSTAFWIGGICAIGSSLLVAMLYFLFDSASSISMMITTLTISVLVSVLARPFIASLRCNRHFKKLALRTIWGKISGAALGVAAAIYGAGEWSLVIQLITMNTLALLILMTGDKSFIFTKPSLSSFVSLFNEGVPIAFRQLTTGFFDKAVIIILASLTTPTAVGYFTFARRLVELPKQALIAAITSYSLPVFSNRNTASEKNNQFFLQISIQTLFLIIPFFIFYGVFGSQLIVDIFGEKWAPSAGYFVFFACIASLQMFSIFVPSLQAAFGTSKIGLKLELIKVSITVGLAYVMGWKFGIYAVIAVISLDALLLGAIRFYSIKMFLNISLRRLILVSTCLFACALAIGSACIYAINKYSLSLPWLALLGVSAAITYLLFCKVAFGISLGSFYRFLKNSK